MPRQLSPPKTMLKGAMGAKIQSDTDAKISFSELRYRRLFEAAQDGILILDASTGKIVDANPFLKKLLGYQKQELLGKELWQIGVFKDILASKDAFLELKSKGNFRYKDIPLLTKSGSTKYVEFISSAYMVDSQQVIQCNFRDISDRRKVEHEVELRTQDLERFSRSQEETQRAMLNVMEDLEEARAVIELEKVKDDAIFACIGEGLLAVDNHNKIMLINKAAEEMLGWKCQEVVGKVITTFPLEDEVGNVIPFESRPTQTAIKTGELVSKTYFFVRKNKTRFPISINVTPIKLGGKIIGAIDIFRDVTHEKEIDKAKSEFVSLASHQLRTPLGIMKWYLEALNGEKYLDQAPDTIRDYFGEIYKSNERVLSLVRDLLSVSRIDQGKVKNFPSSVDLVVIIKEALSQMQIMADKKKIKIVLHSKSSSIPKMNVDAMRFREVIDNLISNAILYTLESGSVDVILSKNEGYLSICVKDTGIGISSSDQKKLFSKFFRSDAAIQHNPEGSGLGLYVVKSYVEGWSGQITVKSSLGNGSEFILSLPFSQKKPVKKGSNV